MERRPVLAAAAVLGLTLALGMVVAGALVGRALYAARASERYVTVKGLSEREVPADLVIWPIVFSVTGDDLSALQGRIEADAEAIQGFLGRLGFPPEEISLSAPRVTDRAAQSYGAPESADDRYVVEATLTVRSGDIERARQAIERSGELVKAGVTLIRSYEYQTQYFFTGLDQIKPEMIAEATRDARQAAQQFAADSGSSVGAIRNAQQGYFSIEDRDAFTPEEKKVRVVTTVEYFMVGR